MIDQEVREMLGPDATFEQEQGAAAAVANDALWLRADNRLREKVTTANEVVMEGRRYRRLEQDSSAIYHSPWGSHRIEEALYREMGVHNGPTIKPIELQVGIIEHMTPDMARIVGELSADRSSRGVERTLRVTRLVPPSRAFLAKHTTEMGIEIADQVRKLEQVAREAEVMPAEVASLSTGLDRMSVRMAEPADPATLDGCDPSSLLKPPRFRPTSQGACLPLRRKPLLNALSLTGLGSYSAAQIVAVLKQGVDKDGKGVCPPMPAGMAGFANLTDQDANDIAGYLLSIPPVDNAVSGTCVVPTP